MLRLAHRILLQEHLPAGIESVSPDPEYWIEVYSDTRRAIRSGVPVIVADNVAEYWADICCTDPSTAVQRLSSKGLPPFPPPFSGFFVEYNTPSKLLYENADGITSIIGCEQSIIKQSGVMFRDMSHKLCEPEFLEYNYGHTEFTTDILAQTRWLLAALFLEFYTPKNMPSFIWTRKMELLLLDEKGFLCDRRIRYAHEKVPESFYDTYIAALTLGFMQCKNVEYVIADVGPTPKWCRRQRLPQLSYQTLLIDPNLSLQKREQERKTDGDRSGKALHIVRGHFAHYSDDGKSKGLFGQGRYGTFWVPSHARGSLKHGQVVSKYEVKPIKVSMESDKCL